MGEIYSVMSHSVRTILNRETQPEQVDAVLAGNPEKKEAIQKLVTKILDLIETEFESEEIKSQLKVPPSVEANRYREQVTSRVEKAVDIRW